jgi:hypothetical protein
MPDDMMVRLRSSSRERATTSPREARMMAHDSRFSPEPRPLSDETLQVLRAAVLSHLERKSAPERGLEQAVAAVVDEARKRSMRPEELIIAFKALYALLPDPPTTAARTEQVRLREQLVTECIRAYYARDGKGDRV